MSSDKINGLCSAVGHVISIIFWITAVHAYGSDKQDAAFLVLSAIYIEITTMRFTERSK